MAGRGPAPKDAASRRRRNAETIPTTSLLDDGEPVGPTLAEATLVDDWHDLTRAWWEDWRRSAQAKAFTRTDWRVLARTAFLYERFASDPSTSLASEIRLVEASLGATVVDRQRARMTVTRPDEADVVELRPVPARESIAARLAK